MPAIAWWPGHVAAGRTSKHVAYFGDWMATACQLAGARMPDGCDSTSFVPTLLNKAAGQKEHEYLYWEFHEGGFKQAAIYEGRWKGIRSGGPSEPIELYDLQNDIAEKTNVAAKHPGIVAKLDAYLSGARSESPDWPAQWRAGKKQGH